MRKMPMDPWDGELLRPPQIVEIGENAGLDEFADESVEPATAPVPSVAAAVTSQRTVEAAREIPEPMISSARASSACASTRGSRLFRPPAWCDRLSPGEIRALRAFAAFLAVLAYAGVVIGIWGRALASDRRLALASAEVARTQPSTPAPVPVPMVPVPIFPSPIPTAPIAAPSVTPPAPAPTPPPTPLTTPVTTVPEPPGAGRTRVQTGAQRRRLSPPPIQLTPNAPRPLAAPASPIHTPSLAVGGNHAEPERETPSEAVAAALPPGAAAGEPRLVKEPPAAAVTAVDPLAADRSAVTEVLSAYRKSYNNLDAGSASAIWEGVDERALRRAFSSLSHQNVSFERCDVRVPAGNHAVARCDGVLSYVPKFGDSSTQQRRMTWNMDFRRNGDRWKIVSVMAADHQAQ